jgi:hypothetical protein
VERFTKIIARSYLFGLIQYKRAGEASILSVAGFGLYARIGSRFALFGVFMPWELR